MKIGLCLPQLGGHADAAAVGRFAAHAERLGYSSLWVGDRALAPTDPTDLYPGSGTPDYPYPSEFRAVSDPFITLALAASATSNARLATSTLNVLWYHPLLLARALTSLDIASSGRVDLGVGLGWLRDEYTALNVPWTGKPARLDETLDVLEVLWTHNPVEYHGTVFDIPRSHFDLRPTHAGGPPIWFGGFGHPTMNRVGTRGAGWLSIWQGSAEPIRTLWMSAREVAEQAGRDPNSLGHRMRVNLSPDETSDDAIQILDKIERSVAPDAAFLDLHYCTATVDESLDYAERVSAALQLI